MNAMKHAVTLLLVALFSAAAMTAVQAEVPKSGSKSTCVGSIDYDNLTPEEYFDLYKR